MSDNFDLAHVFPASLYDILKLDRAGAGSSVLQSYKQGDASAGCKGDGDDARQFLVSDDLLHFGIHIMRFGLCEFSQNFVFFMLQFCLDG